MNSNEKSLTTDQLAQLIDHTLLKPDATKTEIKKLCEEAIKHRFYSVCLNSSWIKYAKIILEKNPTKLVAVIGFPLGATSSETKSFEAKNAVLNGADEIDMVIHIGHLKDKNDLLVEKDITDVVLAASPAPVKVILETCLLTDEEITRACLISKKAGAAFVKTSTGFSKGGATIEHIRLMVKTVAPNLKVKASGGIKTYSDAIKLIEAGASRLGTSQSVAIVLGKETASNQSY